MGSFCRRYGNDDSEGNQGGDAEVTMPPHPTTLAELIQFPKQHVLPAMQEQLPAATFYVHNSTLVGGKSPLYYVNGEDGVILAMCCSWQYPGNAAYWPFSGGCRGSC